MDGCTRDRASGAVLPVMFPASWRVCVCLHRRVGNELIAGTIFISTSDMWTIPVGLKSRDREVRRLKWGRSRWRWRAYCAYCPRAVMIESHAALRGRGADGGRGEGVRPVRRSAQRMGPVSRDLLHVRVAGAICQYIYAENLRIGDRLPSERTLAERLNAGRTTVREALGVLRAEA